MVQNIRKRIGQREIYGVTRYTKRNGLEGWVSIVWVEHGPKYKEKDWRKSDLRGGQIYEEEWTGGVRMVQNIRKRIGQTVIYGVSRYTKRNGLDEEPGREQTSVSMAKRVRKV